MMRKISTRNYWSSIVAERCTPLRTHGSYSEPSPIRAVSRFSGIWA